MEEGWDLDILGRRKTRSVELALRRLPQRGFNNKAQANGLGITASTSSSPERAKYSESPSITGCLALSGLGDLLTSVIPRALPWALLPWPRWGRVKCPNPLPSNLCAEHIRLRKRVTLDSP